MNNLTKVTTFYLKDTCNHRILFGEPKYRIQKTFRYGTITRHAYYFEPETTFALELWARNGFGTVLWNIYVCRSLEESIGGHRVPCIDKAVDILLAAKGPAQASRALSWFDEVGDSTQLEALNPDKFYLADFSLNAPKKTQIKKKISF